MYGITGYVIHALKDGQPVCDTSHEVDSFFDEMPVSGKLCEPCTHLRSLRREVKPLPDHSANSLWLKWLFRREKSYALSQMDWKLAQYMGFHGGKFVEVGANDGLRQSNTFFFEKYRDWHGVLIEVDPNLVAKCRKNRPGSQVVLAAVVSPNWEGPAKLRRAGLMSLLDGSRHERDEEDYHIALGLSVQGMKPKDEQITVPAKTLDEILTDCGLTSFDFLSLDVEGMEEQVLMGLTYRPRFILAEARYREVIDNRMAYKLYRPIAKLGFYDILYQREEDYALC